ncbi:hypothetical protein Btru_055725, partial [Bulinus truncatus]
RKKSKSELYKSTEMRTNLYHTTDVSDQDSHIYESPISTQSPMNESSSTFNFTTDSASTIIPATELKSTSHLTTDSAFTIIPENESISTSNLTTIDSNDTTTFSQPIEPVNLTTLKTLISIARNVTDSLTVGPIIVTDSTTVESTNATSKCHCNIHNSVSCDSSSGACLCIPSWQGPTCNDDVDECSNSSLNNCPSNSNCRNTVGGYECLCWPGYYKNYTGHCHGCGGEVTDQAGLITSPNFPQNYPDNVVCTWNITVATNQIINVKFTWLDLHIYYNPYCMDNITFFDGPTDQYPRINNTVYCGYSFIDTSLDIPIRSKGNQMLVVFRSDSMGSRTGFNITYTALKCDPFTYGRDSCDSNCNCNQMHADYCDNIDGGCVCNANWTGPNCSILVDHCQDPNICSDPYGICVNVLGSYECRCKTGLKVNSTGHCEDPKNCTQIQCSHYCGVMSGDPQVETCFCPKGMMLNTSDNTQCVECEQWYFGDNCTYYTRCDQNRTESYDKPNGFCHCYPNWTSTYCTEDFDECSYIAGQCVLEKDHGRCLNTPGSFECQCLPGYEPLNKTSCDECGKVLTEPSGNIISHYHFEYQNSWLYQVCNWTILAPVGQVVSLR